MLTVCASCNDRGGNLETGHHLLASSPLSPTPASRNVHRCSNYRSVATSGSNKSKHHRRAFAVSSEAATMEARQATIQQRSVQHRLEENERRKGGPVSLERPKKDPSLSFPFPTTPPPPLPSPSIAALSRVHPLSLSLPASSRAFLLHPPSREANRIRNKTSHLEIYETNEDLTYTVKLDLRLSISHSAFSFPISLSPPPPLSLFDILTRSLFRHSPSLFLPLSSLVPLFIPFRCTFVPASPFPFHGFLLSFFLVSLKLLSPSGSIRVKGTRKEGIARAASRRVVRKVQVRRSATISWDEVAVRRVRKESPTVGERRREKWTEKKTERRS